ncbi:MAG: hypothetical protein GXP41_05975 [Chloroflexi bacterium]|nr:hypothetical protein [Chloroflexota bacterium]
MKKRLGFVNIGLLLALVASLWLPFAGLASADHGEQELRGVVQTIPAGRIGMWVVSNQNVQVTTATRIKEEHGAITVGTQVKVKGYAQNNGSFMADKIERDGDGGGNDHQNESKFNGTINAMPAGRLGDWNVSGQTVHVSANTWINEEHGQAAVGASVEVKGTQRADGSWDATEIDVQQNSGGGNDHHNDSKFYGTIEAMPAGRLGDWTISGQTVHVSANTWINEEHGQAAVGAYVEVDGVVQTDGSWDASKVEVRNASGGDQTYDDFYGTVETMPANRIGMWVVSGRNVQVDANTRIDEQHGAATAGAYVEVKGARQADGSTLATEIDVQATGTTGPNPTPTPPSGGTVVYIDPAQATAGLNGTLNVELKVANVVNMGGYELVINFDPAIVQVQNVTLGNFLSSTGRTVSPLGPSVDNTAGRISIGSFSFGSQAGPSGEGTLATIVMTPQAQGTSALTLSGLTLTDSAGNAIAATTQDGAITINATALNGDLNGDCSVDVVDIMQVAGRWGSQSGEVEYDEADDLDHNGQIDVVDIMQVAGHWGESCASGGLTAMSTGIAATPDATPALSLAVPAAVQAGKTFTAEAKVTDAADLGSFEFQLSFDPALVEVKDVALADALSNSGNTCQALSKVDNAAGTLRIAGFCFGSQAGLQGASSLAQITFAAHTAGNVDLQMAGAKVTTMAGQTLQATASDAALMVHAAPAKIGPRMPTNAPAQANQ